MQRHGKKSSSKRADPDPPAGAPAPTPGAPQEESGLAAARRRFTKRLATFGLGEAQKPLLTEGIWSLDDEGSPE